MISTRDIVYIIATGSFVADTAIQQEPIAKVGWGLATTCIGIAAVFGSDQNVDLFGKLRHSTEKMRAYLTKIVRK